MGLDSLWRIDGDPPSEVGIVPDREYHLVGGIMSGHGQDSFRGGAYDAFIREQFPGATLYDDLPNSTVVKMGEWMYDHEWAELPWAWDHDENSHQAPRTPEEYDDFRHMFRYYGKHGAELIAWY